MTFVRFTWTLSYSIEICPIHCKFSVIPSLCQENELNELLFITEDKTRARGANVKGSWCCERQRAKVGWWWSGRSLVSFAWISTIPYTPRIRESQGTYIAWDVRNNTSSLSDIIFFIPTLFLNIPYPYHPRVAVRSDSLPHSRRSSLFYFSLFSLNLVILRSKLCHERTSKFTILASNN